MAMSMSSQIFSTPFSFTFLFWRKKRRAGGRRGGEEEEEGGEGRRGREGREKQFERRLCFCSQEKENRGEKKTSRAFHRTKGH